MVQTADTAKAVPDCETVGEIGQPLGAQQECGAEEKGPWEGSWRARYQTKELAFHPGTGKH